MNKERNINQETSMFEEYGDIVSVDDVMKMLHIGRSAVYSLLQNGVIRTVKVGRKYIIPTLIEKQNDFPQIRFHDLRHSVASNLLNDGFTTVQVAEWLGHSSSTTTLKFYAHIDKTSKLAIANSLQAD